MNKPLFIMNLPTALYALLVLQFGACDADICEKTLCEYRFVVRLTPTMMFTSGKVSYPVKISSNGSLTLQSTTFNRYPPNISVPVDEVHTVDGHTRTIITINGQFPGPTIEVMEGTQVAVNVVNELLESSLTIHFHGMHMKHNPWMDGAAYISQCPVMPKESFQYRFIATPAGTHWYHSHFEGQRADGLFGPLIVHRSTPSLPYMTLMINDWYSMPVAEILLKNPFYSPVRGVGDIYDDLPTRSFIFDGTETSSLRYWSGLINGRGRRANNTSPLSVLKVKQGHKYRLHLIFSSLEHNYAFSIDQHELTVVETDGFPVQPVQVESLLGFMGERFVVEFTANQSINNYWIRAKTLRTGQGTHPQPDGKEDETLAIIEYEGAIRAEPETSPRNCTENHTCVVLNCPWKIYHKDWYPNRQCIPITDLRFDTNVHNAKDSTSRNDDIFEIFLNFGFPIGSSVNQHKHVMPRAPLHQDSSTWGTIPCPEDCADKGCVCTHVIEIPPNRTVQMVFTSNSMSSTYNNGTIKDITTMHHPVHVHGHSFQVLKMGFPTSNSKTGRIEKQNSDIVCENGGCSKQRWADGHPIGLNFNNPPVKDTVVVPASGYVVIRFKSDNPGYWFLHCHQILHNLEGMSLILNESHASLPPPPPNVTTCKDFSMTSDEFQLMLEKNKQRASNKCTDNKGISSGASSRQVMPTVSHICLLIFLFLGVFLDDL